MAKYTPKTTSGFSDPYQKIWRTRKGSRVLKFHTKQTGHSSGVLGLVQKIKFNLNMGRQVQFKIYQIYLEDDRYKNKQDHRSTSGDPIYTSGHFKPIFKNPKPKLLQRIQNQLMGHRFRSPQTQFGYHRSILGSDDHPIKGTRFTSKVSSLPQRNLPELPRDYGPPQRIYPILRNQDQFRGPHTTCQVASDQIMGIRFTKKHF